MTVMDKLRQMHAAGRLEPFIRHIRFPHYKNLAPKTRIDFDFPLTALVGPNGTNKSSVLRALYGVPGYNNLGKLWFSTKVDPIADTGNRPRFIYGFLNTHAGQVVEVVKSRIHKENDPDYWEPSRPLIRDGMTPPPPMPEGEEEVPGRHKTRWANIDKEVLYIDFRSEISAYDKYFYHGELNQTLTVRTKQDYIRRQAGPLRKTIDENLDTFEFRHREKVVENRLLPVGERKAAEAILKREYASIRHVRHRFFGQEGHSIILQHRDLTYSEAFAGSGEFAAIMLVIKVWNTPEKSLILLDEPEVSLHPGAQEALVAFLLDQIKRKKHQVVLSTHSPTMVKGLPPEAIKTFHLDKATGLAVVRPAAMPEEAFFHLGETGRGRIRIIVEDRLGVELVKAAIHPYGEAATKAFEIIRFPGGAQTLTQHYVPIFSMEGRSDTLLLLDGDQRRESPPPDPDTIPSSQDGELQSMVDAFAGGEVRFLVDGRSGGGGGDEEQMTAARRGYLKWVRGNVDYLPGTSPEAFVWDQMPKDSATESITAESPKERFLHLTRQEFVMADFDKPSADAIFYTQKRRLATIPADHPELLRLGRTLVAFATARGGASIVESQP